MSNNPKGSTIHLKGPGLNDYFAERMVQDLGPLKALEKSSGPMAAAVRQVAAGMRESTLRALSATVTERVGRHAVEAFTALQQERDALLWAFCQFMDGTKYHDMPGDTGLPRAECDAMWQLWLDLKDEGMKPRLLAALRGRPTPEAPK